MSKTYRAPRKFQISGKAGKVKMKMGYSTAEANLIAHELAERKKLSKLRKNDRRWKLAAAAAANGRLLNGR